jgi:primosomal protein N' (replication factor Y)
VLRVAIPGRQARIEKAWIESRAGDVAPPPPTPELPEAAGVLPGLVEARRRIALECAGGVAAVEAAAKKAGFASPEAIGPYMRTLISTHRDTLGPILPMGIAQAPVQRER